MRGAAVCKPQGSCPQYVFRNTYVMLVPAWLFADLRSPYDSPLRDGNRDRLIGLLTERYVGSSWPGPPTPAHLAISLSAASPRSKQSASAFLCEVMTMRTAGSLCTSPHPILSPMNCCCRATKTLMVYLMETNVNVYSWLVSFYKENPIPKVSSSACSCALRCISHPQSAALHPSQQ